MASMRPPCHAMSTIVVVFAAPRELVVRAAHEHERRYLRALEGFGGRDRGVELNRDPAPGRLGLHELVGDLGDGDVVVDERQARAHASRPPLGAFAPRLPRRRVIGPPNRWMFKARDPT